MNPGAPKFLLDIYHGKERGLLILELIREFASSEFGRIGVC
jgi:hypothetical protein